MHAPPAATDAEHTQDNLRPSRLRAKALLDKCEIEAVRRRACLFRQRTAAGVRGRAARAPAAPLQTPHHTGRRPSAAAFRSNPRRLGRRPAPVPDPPIPMQGARAGGPQPRAAGAKRGRRAAS